MRYRDEKLNDYLDANATWKRTLRLQVNTPELLRIGDNRRQRREQQGLLDEARVQLRAGMRSKHRRVFRGEVSVELDIFAPDGVEPPSAPKSVKRYLDALKGIVYTDDRQVGHLLVRRFAPDHPHARRAATSGIHVPQEPRKAPTVHITVMPLRLYVADYDRVFARRKDLIRRAGDLDGDGAALFQDAWGHDHEREELDDLYEERSGDRRGDGVYGLDNPELADRMRSFRESRIAELQGKFILRARPDRDDRPGPDLVARDVELFRSVGLSDANELPRYDLPGTTWLPPLLTRPRRSGEPTWSELARRNLETHRTRWRILPDVFDQPLALDIAIHGSPKTAHDIDNVAHTILKAFEELYCADRRGTVVAYRVYRQASEHAGVRVHLMTDRKFWQLDAAISEARQLVLLRDPDA